MYIYYKLENNKILKDNIEIPKKQARLELKSYQLKKLKDNKEVRKRVEDITPKKSRDEKLLEKHRKDYKVEEHMYSSGIRLELWRKNPRYGYYNFIAYLEDATQETIDKIILQNLAKEK